MNPNTAFLQSYFDDNYVAMQDASVFVFPYTQAEVYVQALGLFKAQRIEIDGGVTLPSGFKDTVGFNTLIAFLTGPLATPEDLRLVMECFHLFVDGSEVANGYLPFNIIMDLVNDYLDTNGATIAAICLAVATPAEAQDAAQAMLRVRGLLENAGADPPTTDITDAFANLQTAVAAVVPSDSPELAAILHTLAFIMSEGENDQSVVNP